MNDFELNARLKRISPPERSEAYWDDFPSRVRVQLLRVRPDFTMGPKRWPRFAWAGSMALAMTMAFVCLQFHPLQTASSAITKHEQCFRSQLARLDAGLHVLMFNPHGMSYLLAEAN